MIIIYCEDKSVCLCVCLSVCLSVSVCVCLWRNVNTAEMHCKYDNHIPCISAVFIFTFLQRRTQTDRQTNRQTDLSPQYMIIIFPVHLSCIHIPSKTHRQTDTQTDRLISTIYDNHIPSASQLYSHSFKDRERHRQIDRHTDRQTDRQTDRLISTIYDNHIHSASQLYSHSFKDRQTDRQTDRHTDTQTDRQTYLHNIW